MDHETLATAPTQATAMDDICAQARLPEVDIRISAQNPYTERFYAGLCAAGWLDRARTPCPTPARAALRQFRAATDLAPSAWPPRAFAAMVAAVREGVAGAELDSALRQAFAAPNFDSGTDCLVGSILGAPGEGATQVIARLRMAMAAPIPDWNTLVSFLASRAEAISVPTWTLIATRASEATERFLGEHPPACCAITAVALRKLQAVAAERAGRRGLEPWATPDQLYARVIGVGYDSVVAQPETQSLLDAYARLRESVRRNGVCDRSEVDRAARALERRMPEVRRAAFRKCADTGH
jgi:hypothetical protein